MFVFPIRDFGMSFVLESYIGNYSGPTKIDRLLFIARNSEEHKQNALGLAFAELRGGRNVRLFREAFSEFYKASMPTQDQFLFHDLNI